jgi:hypothetical protein
MGMPALAGAWGRYILNLVGFCQGYGHIWKNPNKYLPAKIFCEAYNFVSCLDFDKRFFAD